MNFNVPKLRAELKRRCVEVLKQAQDGVYNDTLSKVRLPEALTDYEKSEIVELVVGVLTCTITGGAWAVMDEWGTGSLMDMLNPALDEYVGSDLWNPARPGHAIRTRPPGPYTNIFGEQQVAVGSNPGFNLESQMNRPNPPNILLTPPSHAFRQALGWLRSAEFALLTHQILQDMDFGQFLELDVDLKGGV